MWSGLPTTPQEALDRYDVDEVRYSTEVNACLVGLSKPARSMVWAIPTQVSDHITFLEFDGKDFSTLKEAIDECRVVKDDYEVALVRKANEVSTIAHTAVLRAVKQAENERELEALFIQRCIAHGCREQAYHSIVASGSNAATLHYQKNNESLGSRWNLLLDAGAEFGCYAADITRTFPIDGRFNETSRNIYDIVLRMQRECIAMLKEGVLWDDVHAHAHTVAIDGLLQLGILRGGSPDDIFNARTSVAFFPHGLGHHLGMDVHDTGGHPNYADEDSMFRYLRVRGRLPAGSIITVEPGVCKRRSPPWSPPFPCKLVRGGGVLASFLDEGELPYFLCSFFWGGGLLLRSTFVDSSSTLTFKTRRILASLINRSSIGTGTWAGFELKVCPLRPGGGAVLDFLFWHFYLCGHDEIKVSDVARAHTRTHTADDVLITTDGYENLTTAIKEVEEMEKLINES